jgi:hypothetical protein
MPVFTLFASSEATLRRKGAMCEWTLQAALLQEVSTHVECANAYTNVVLRFDDTYRYSITS